MNVLFSKYKALIIVVFILFSQLAFSQRARDPWVFRSVIDEIPRAITFALHKDLWATYDTESCRLVKLWNGDIDFQGEVYNGVKAIQPMHTGLLYLNDKDSINYILIFDNGKWQKPAKTKFISYRILNNKASMQYEISTSSGNKAVIEESPEHWVNNIGNNGFQRIWKVKSNPSFLKLGARLIVPQMPTVKSFETNGAFEINEKAEKYADNTTTFTLKGILSLQADKPTELTHYFAK
jgi:hypothetical protein